MLTLPTLYILGKLETRSNTRLVKLPLTRFNQRFMQRSARLRTVSSRFCDLFLESKHRSYIIYNYEKVSPFHALKIINFGWEKGGTESIFSTRFFMCGLDEGFGLR